MYFVNCKDATKQIIVGLAVVLFSSLASPSFADTFHRVGLLKCDSKDNKFIVRFGVLHNDDSLDNAELSEAPSEALQDWSSMALLQEKSCRLADGKKISLSTKKGQAFAYGMGGGDPNASFILRIDEKVIYFNAIFYNGYGAAKYSINSVIYQKHKLSECSAYNNKEIEKCTSQGKNRNWCVLNSKKNEAVECVDASARLTGDALSQEEKQELVKEEEKRNLEAATSSFCKDIRASAPSRNESYEYLGKIPSSGPPQAHLSALSIDINNDGKLDKLFRIGGSSADCVSCGTHSFDGSALIAFMHGQDKISDFLDHIKNNSYDIETMKNIQELPEWGAHLISLGLAGSSASYVYNVPFEYKGRNYIYAYETNREKTPSSNISEITPSSEIKTLCKFP